jgi:hypothetical protein
MMQTPLHLLRRGQAWKNYVGQTLLDLITGQAKLRRSLARAALRSRALRSDIERLHGEVESLRQQILPLREQLAGVTEAQAARFHRRVTVRVAAEIPQFSALGDGYKVLVTRRAAQLVFLFLAAGDQSRAELKGEDPSALLPALLEGSIHDAVVIMPDGQSGHMTLRSVALQNAIIDMPREAAAWLTERLPRLEAKMEPSRNYFYKLTEILKNIDLVDFYAATNLQEISSNTTPAPPFDEPETLPNFCFATPRRHSALFLHNNYYHFNCLAAGLRKRGWDVLTVSLESPASPQQQFFHGEDLNLFDTDPAVMVSRSRDFFRTVPERYGALHFSGQGCPTFFTETMENGEHPQILPWDFLELRRHRMTIGYMPSGCTDGGLQSSIHELTGGLCDRCVWQLRPDVCSDARSLAWNRKLALLCDWVGLECDHATPERISRKSVYGPVVTTLDPDRWHPDIEVPEDMRIDRRPGEILVYHAVGNYASRRAGDRDIKGTGAVVAAIEQLKGEGLPVRLIFAHDIPSTRVRFLQVQADIVVDQLNYGRYGANARESMMLGRPTICRLSALQAAPLQPLRPILQAPLKNADEQSVVDVLRALVLDREGRLELGRRSREFALAWHGQDACAERYERVIDRVRAGLPPESPDLYPT